MVDEKGIVNLDQDLVRDLRRRGLYAEASKLVQEHYKQIHLAGVRARHEFDLNMIEIKKIKRICTVRDCNKKTIGKYNNCSEHRAISSRTFTKSMEGKKMNDKSVHLLEEIVVQLTRIECKLDGVK